MAEADAEADGGTVGFLFIICAVDALILSLVVTHSRWRGWPLILGLAFAFYGVQTVVGQIEAVISLTPLGERWGAGSVPALTMPIDFILSQFYVGAGMALTGVPLAARLFGKAKRDPEGGALRLNPGIQGSQWLWKVGAIVLLYGQTRCRRDLSGHDV